MGKIYSSVVELVGSTPLVELRKIKEKYSLKSKILAKLEYFNPAGSIKDRAALFMINDAERRGILKKDSVVIEATSGNTGIGLALIASQRGYRTIIVMPDTMSKERISLMRAFGAEVALSDGALGMAGAIELSEKLAAKHKNSFIPSQFSNPSNTEAHFSTTGPEIWRDTDGEVDILVAGVGTGGTVMGTGKYLKAQKPGVQIVGVEPFSSPFITKGKKGAHAIQGIGAGFIPEIFDTELPDRIMTVEDEEAINTCLLLSRLEGVFAGISSGAALAAAIKLAKEEENKCIVCIVTDTGSRYLSTGIFDKE